MQYRGTPWRAKAKKDMAKIIKLEASRQPLKKPPGHRTSCQHKNVIAYTAYRTVQCVSCGAVLDSFDVLVDMIKGYPPDGEKDEQRRFDREVRKREGEKEKDD